VHAARLYRTLPTAGGEARRPGLSCTLEDSREAPDVLTVTAAGPSSRGFGLAPRLLLAAIA